MPATGPDAAVVAQILAGVHARPATLGPGRLLCIDGPAGSGKTTLAVALADAAAAQVVHMDDLFPGWEGMNAVGPHVHAMLQPLADGRPGAYRRYDWVREAYAEAVAVPVGPLLVLEGVNSGNRAWSHWCTFLVWVETAAQTRLDRGMARDGEQVRSRWEKWMREEDDLFAREDTRARADLVVLT